jgi:hypothetical protein
LPQVADIPAEGQFLLPVLEPSQHLTLKETTEALDIGDGRLLTVLDATCRMNSAIGIDFSAVSAVGRQRCLGCDPGGPRRKRSVRRDSADDRYDHHPRASLRGRWKGGTERNALGRSRGGFSTKINARTNAEGLPIGIEITPG